MRIFGAGLEFHTLVDLKSQGFTADNHAPADEDELAAWLLDGSYDAGILHLEHSGIELRQVQELRMKKLCTPLIGLAYRNSGFGWKARSCEFLEHGGDFLLSDPADPQELAATLHAAIRRSKGLLSNCVKYKAGAATLEVDFERQIILVNAERVHLSPKLTEIMLMLAQQPGRVVTKDTFFSTLYLRGLHEEPEPKILDVFVCYLRRKLGKVHPDAKRLIQTVWGKGYCLSPQEIAPAHTTVMA